MGSGGEGGRQRGEGGELTSLRSDFEGLGSSENVGGIGGVVEFDGVYGVQRCFSVRNQEGRRQWVTRNERQTRGEEHRESGDRKMSSFPKRTHSQFQRSRRE